EVETCFAQVRPGAAAVTANPVAAAAAGLNFKQLFPAHRTSGFGGDRLPAGRIAHAADIGNDREGTETGNVRRGHPRAGYPIHDDVGNFLIARNMAELTVAKVNSGDGCSLAAMAADTSGAVQAHSVLHVTARVAMGLGRGGESGSESE